MRKKILYIVGTDPRSKNYGGEQRTHFIWEGLKKVSEVYTVIPVTRKYLERVDEAEKIRWICFEKRWSIGWVLQQMWRRFFQQVSLPFARDRKRLDQHYDFSFDGCVVRFTSMASSLSAWKIAPLYLDIDDLPTAEFDLYFMNGQNVFRQVQRWILARYQDYVFRHARQLWVADPKHCETLKGYPVSCLPNISCTFTETLKDKVSAKQTLFFVGAMNSSPNFVALDRFLSDYWDTVLQYFPAIELKIAGGGLPADYRERWNRHRNVFLLGFVKDIWPLYEEAICLLTPMCIGAGSCIKVLEALSVGRVCLSTPHGVRGIDARDWVPEKGILVYRNKDELIAALHELMDGDRRKVMQQGAYKLIQQQFSQRQVDEAIKQSLT